MKPRRIDVGEYESDNAAIRSIAVKLGIATPRPGPARPA
jgi:hypothetical protein